jgi:hypothetical protein
MHGYLLEAPERWRRRQSEQKIYLVTVATSETDPATAAANDLAGVLASPDPHDDDHDHDHDHDAESGWRPLTSAKGCAGVARRIIAFAATAGQTPRRVPRHDRRQVTRPPSEDSKPPSNLATTDLSPSDRPGNGSVESFRADVASQ